MDNLLIKDKDDIIIDFYKEIKNNKNYLSLDKVHLSEDGNKALDSILENKLKNQSN